jgi:hypothetical protein
LGIIFYCIEGDTLYFIDMKKITLFILSCIIYQTAFSQVLSDFKRDKVWKMGYQGFLPDNRFKHIDMTYNNTVRIITATDDTASFRATFASICDTNGVLVCYTNGVFLYDRNDIKMKLDTLNPGVFAQSTSFDGRYNIPDAALILPQPENQHLYYLFHLRLNDPHPMAYSGEGLYYTVIDDRLRNGAGGVTAWRVPIVNHDSLETGKVNAVRHANGRDWWITCWRRYFMAYRLCLLDPTGVHDYGWQQVQSTPKIPNSGQSAFSPDGTKWAGLTYNYPIQQSRLDIFDFDRCTGSLTNHQEFLIPLINILTVGLSFSLNSHYLYVSSPSTMLQYDIQAANIPASVDTVAQWDGFQDSIDLFTPLPVLFWTHQYAPDGKIYISSANSTHYMSTIDNPDVRGVGCNVRQHSVRLPAFAIRTVPNFPNFRLGALVGSVCDTIYTAVASPSPSQGGETVHIFPNPATTSTRLVWYEPLKNDANINITNSIGQIMQHIAVSKNATYQDIDTKALANGIYFVTLQNKTLKLIKTE